MAVILSQEARLGYQMYRLTQSCSCCEHEQVTFVVKADKMAAKFIATKCY